MFILKKLTKKDLALNKKRTFGTILGIMLSTALITCVGGMFYVLQNTMVQNAINADGYWHIQLSDISDSDIENISLNKDFNHMEAVKDLGHSITYLNNDDYVHGHIYSMSYDTFDYLGYKLVDGVFPKNSGEIALSKNYSKYAKINIGDELTLNIGDLVDSKGNKINDIFYGNTFIINSKDYTFKVVGLINAHPTLITTGLDSLKNDVYLTLKNPKNYKKDFEELLSSDKYKDYRTNRDLLRWEVFSFSDNTLSFLMKLVGIVIFIILLTSVFSIKNSFAISTTEKLRIYGMLRSVGATKKQIKKMVLLEGLNLGLIGIPIGSFIGLAVTYFLTVIVNTIATSASLSADSSLLYYKFDFYPFIIAFITSFIMIYLSTISSKKKASNISPIQNIRNSENYQNNVDLKVPKLIQKIFKIGGILSYKNLKRSKNKYHVTIISLTISIFVFILVSCFLKYGIKTLNDEYITLNYNVSANVFNIDKKYDIKKLKELAKSHLYYALDSEKIGLFYIRDTSHIIDKRYISNGCTKYDSTNDSCIGEKIPSAHINFLIYDDDSFKEIANNLDLKYENIKDKGILINTAKRIEGKKTKYVKTTTYKKGDVLEFYNNKYDYNLTYEIAAINDYLPWGFETYDGVNPPSLIISEKYFSYKEGLFVQNIYYESDNAEKTEEEIKKISTDINVMNIDKEIKQMQSTILIISIFIYGFIIVVTLIGMTSVFNTITSNMELRRKEFAILKSIGMTKHEFNNMILLESVFYSFKSLFYGIILGVLGSYLIYTIFAERIDYGYLFPTNAIIISVIFIIIVVYAIMKYSISKINKQNVIETIRKENI